MGGSNMGKGIGKFFAAALSFALVASCGGNQASDGGKLYVFNWTYYIPDEVIEDFEKEFGVDVVYDTFDSNESMYSKIKNGASGYDLVFPSADYVTIMAKQGLLERIDKAKVANWKHIDPAVIARASDYDPGNEYSVPYYMGAAGVAVNKKAVGEYDRSWSIFAREDLRGRMTMLDDIREVFGDALKSLGYSVNEIDGARVEQAAKLIRETWRPNLLAFDALAFGKTFSQGDSVVAQGYPEVIFGEIEESLWGDYDFFIPKEGGPLYIDSMCIPKGAKNVELAYKFIDYIHRPEVYAKFCDYFRFPATCNVPARDLLTKKPHYTPDQLAACELKLDLGAALDLYTSAWESIKF
jgi:spermidine/putrescine transport system substrate-binding protein